MKKRKNMPQTAQSGWRHRIHEVIFEADTSGGKIFDVILIGLILFSVVVVMLESVATIRDQYGLQLRVVEWVLTILFTIEYILRLIAVNRPMAYARSFYGIVDLLAILPTYLSLFVPVSRYLVVIRALRILRVFRVLKLVKYLTAADILMAALYSSRRKISVFLYTVLIAVIILGSMMYVIEGEENGFTSIPRSIYWAIVTLTTVGYGDITPSTPIGQALAAVVMILGYGIIAVPTGIVTAELVREAPRQVSTQACPDCSAEGHDPDAGYCKYCGGRL